MFAKVNNFANVKSMVESVEGFLAPGQEEFLFNRVNSLSESAIIAEIGSYKGRSTVAMGYACIGTHRKIYCIDTWCGNDSENDTWCDNNFDLNQKNFYHFWRENVVKNDLQDCVIPLVGYSSEILTQWDALTDGKKIDFIFIDGSHQYSDVLKDFELSYPIVRKGGWIALHDVPRGKDMGPWDGPYRVWHEVAENILINCGYLHNLSYGQK